MLHTPITLVHNIHMDQEGDYHPQLTTILPGSGRDSNTEHSGLYTTNWQKRTLESLFFNSTSEASVIQARNMKKERKGNSRTQCVTKRSVNFPTFFDIFPAIFICIFIAMEIAMEMQHNRASDTFDVKLHNINNTSRREDLLHPQVGEGSSPS